MQQPKSLVDEILIKRLKQVDKLSVAVLKALDLEGSHHRLWVIAELKKLTILCESPILATQIRYQQQFLIDYFRKEHSLIYKDIRVQMASVQAPQTQHSTTLSKHPARIPSANNQKIIRGIAETIDDDDLRECLLRFTQLKN